MKSSYAASGVIASLIGVIGFWIVGRSLFHDVDGIHPVIAPWLAKILSLFASSEPQEMVWRSGTGLTEQRARWLITYYSCIAGAFSIAMAYVSVWRKENEKLSISALFLGSMLFMLLNLIFGLVVLTVFTIGLIWFRSSLTSGSSQRGVSEKK